MTASGTGLVRTSGVHKAFSPTSVLFSSSRAAVQKGSSELLALTSQVMPLGLLGEHCLWLRQFADRHSIKALIFADTQVLLMSALSAGQFLIFG